MNYRKRSSIRNIRKRILILCEGGKTEPNYFNAIKSDKSKSNKLSALRIYVYYTQINTAKELVNEAVKLKKEAKREKNPYDDIWIVFDKDGYTKHPESFNRAKDNKLKIAFSSPCFEFWYLLHFRYTTSAFENGDIMCNKLSYCIPDYKKADDHYEILKTKTDIAIENGKKIIQHWKEVSDGKKIWTYNPYTDVGVLVEKLLNV